MSAGRPTAPSEREVRRMFDRIVPRYDIVNELLSLGMDRMWRRRTVAALQADPDGVVLDLGCGTGRLIQALDDGGYRAIGLDLSAAMLLSAARRAGLDAPLVQGSAFRLPFRDGAFAGAASAFVLRNLDDLPAAFAELARVVRPGGRIALVDITEPDSAARRRAFRLYFRMATTVLGTAVGRRKAYRYLFRSLKNLPQPDQLCRLLEVAGFERCRARSLPPGAVTLWTATRARTGTGA